MVKVIFNGVFSVNLADFSYENTINKKFYIPEQQPNGISTASIDLKEHI